MLQQLIQQFLNSNHGNDAATMLQQQQGITPEQAQQAMAAVTEAVHQEAGSPTDMNGMANSLGSFGSAVLGGLGGALGGGGLSGALQGGAASVVASKAAQMIAQRTGMDPNKASLVAAAAMPFVLRYVQQHVGGARAGQGAAPGGMPNMPNMPNMGAIPGAWPQGTQGNPSFKGDPGDKSRPGEGASPAAPNPAKPEHTSPWKKLI